LDELLAAASAASAADADPDAASDSDTDSALDLDSGAGLEAELEGAPAGGGGRRFARRGSPKLQTLQSLPLRLALGGAVVFVVGLLITAGAKSYRDLQIVRQREAALAVRIAASEERLEAQRHRLQLLSDDPATLERLAREELGLVGKDDIVFVLPPSESAPSPAP
jgi:cell division protein FtsB